MPAVPAAAPDSSCRRDSVRLAEGLALRSIVRLLSVRGVDD
jgi:hypothetical protein